MNGITVTIIDSFEEWAEAAPQWKTLLDESGSSSFFQTGEWLISWAEGYLGSDRSLYILACHKKDKLVGIAPFYLEKRNYGPFFLKELRFLGTPESGSDYLDVIICEKYEEEVAEAIYTFLTDTASRDWDQMVLTDIRSDSLFLLHFIDRMEADGKYVELNRHASCPVVRLPDSEQELYERMTAGWRRKFRRNTRLIHKHYQVSYTAFHGQEAADRLDDFFEMYEQTNTWSRKTLHRVLKQLVKYLDPPPIQLGMVIVDGKPLAALLHFTYMKTISPYLMSVDKTFDSRISLGSFLVGQSILNSIENEYSFYDFLKGTERYKFHWATDIHSTVQVRFWQRKPAALCSALNRLSRSAGKLFLR